MRIFFNGLAIGLFVGCLLGWFASQKWSQPSPANERFRQETVRAADAAREALFRAREALKAKAEALNLRPEQVKEELARAGEVVRRQSHEVAELAADASVDASTTAAVKARLVGDPELSGLAIEVSATAGHVTLDGSVRTPEQVSRAVVLALEVGGVARVTARLKVEPG